MVTLRQGTAALEGWLTRVEADDQPELHSLAAGIRRDQDAVTADLSLPYNSGAMEGNVNKIKMIKRQMYGRASFPSSANVSSFTPRNHDHKFAEEPRECRQTLIPNA
jgi:transposase